MPARRGQGEGSIYQRPDGTWVAQLDMGTIAGVRKRPIRRARTKKEALRKLDDMKRTRDAGAMPDAATVEQWLTYWLDHVVDPKVAAGQLKPSTAAGYRSHVHTWLIPQLGKVRMSRLGPVHIRGLHQTMRDHGKAPATIRNVHATLRKAMAVAVADRRLPRMPFGDVTAPTPQHTYDVLDADQAMRVIAAAATDPRTLARIHVAILGGLRQGEALALRWDTVSDTHIGVRGSLARVDGVLVTQAPKTRAATRDVPMAPALAASMAAWRSASGGQGYVFHGFDGPHAPEGAARDHRAWKTVLEAAGVPLVPLHGARGTCATLMQAAGVPPRVVADILGQANVTVLLQHYSHSDEVQRSAAVAQLGRSIEP